MQISIPRRLRIYAVFLFLLLQSSLVHAQIENAKGRIEGTVLRAGSTEPVVGARVTLTRPGSSGNTGGLFATTASGGGSVPLPRIPTPATPSLNPSGAAFVLPPIPVVTTDRAGKFVISSIDAGSYRLFVTGNGYVRQEYGQKIPGGSGAPLVLTAGQVLKDLTISITQTGDVGGRIVDNYGQPAVGAPLRLVRVSFNQNGQRIFQTVGSARTNDRGEYRIFWVTPGRYYLSGGTPPGPPIGLLEDTRGPNENGDSHAFTFYPGVTDLTRATMIDLRPGNDLTLDFAVHRQELYSIRGRVVDPSSNVPPASVGIGLSFQSITTQNAMAGSGASYDATMGTFQLLNVVPGSYLLYVNSQEGVSRTPVEVVNANIEGIVATVSSPMQIPGRFSIEGGGTIPFGSASRVQFRPIVGGAVTLFGVIPSSGTVSSDGSFQVGNVMPGEYHVMSVPPEGHYVKEA